MSLAEAMNGITVFDTFGAFAILFLVLWALIEFLGRNLK